MENNSGIRIDKLREDNFHTWKTRIQLVLSLKEVDSYISDDPPDRESDSYSEWRKGDLKAKALIGLTLSDTHLEQVQHAYSAKEMWILICDIFEKHTLLNKLAARRRFYTAKMHDTEKILAFAARVRQMAATLKSMSVSIEDSEMAMALLNGLPDRFDSFISALDAAHTDDDHLTFELVQSRCLQEEQRHAQRDQDPLKRFEAAALLATGSKSRKFTSAETCVHCRKHHDSSRCYFKYPHLAPQGHPARAQLDKAKKDSKALVAQTPSDTQLPLENDYKCLLGVPPAHDVALQSSQHMATSSSHWIIDSSCTSHVTHDRSVFISYTNATTTSSLDLGAHSSALIVGRGDVKLNLCLPNGENKPCLVKNVQHVPDLRYQLLSVSAMAKLGISVQFDESCALLV